MEIFFFEPEKFNRMYNCSFYSVEQIPLEKRQHQIAGTIYLVFYVVFFLTYSMCIYTMATTKLRQLKCYQFMILLGCIHLVGLQIGGLFPAVFSIEGAVYCSHPNLGYIVGCLAMSSWCGSTMTNLILGINRICELYGGDLAEKVFGGRRIYVWMSFPFAYMWYIFWFTPSCIWSSTVMAYFFNPHIGYFDDGGAVYHSGIHAVNNLTVCFTEPIVYVTLIVLYRRAVRYGSAEFKKKFQMEKKIYVQVVLIGFVHLTASSIYVAMQFIPMNFYTVLVANTAYYFSQGLPSVIYITINRTLRAAIFKKLNAVSTSPVSISLTVGSLKTAGKSPETLPTSPTLGQNDEVAPF